MRIPDSPKGLLAAASAVAAVFWLGLVALWLAAAARYFPDYGLEFRIGPPLALIILAYAVDFLRRARWMATLRGHAVAIGPKQYPDLYERLRAVCKRLEIPAIPALWLYADPRHRASFSLRYAGEDHLVLNAELVGAFTEHQGALDYFLGAEIARLSARERRLGAVLAPVRVVPLIGPAFSRAQIYATDRAGLAACRARADAALALAYWASGSRRWKSLSLLDFAAQSSRARGFMSSLMELTSARPWLSRRIARLHSAATGSQDLLGARHPFAYLAGMFVPALGPGGTGVIWRLLVLSLWGGMLALGTVTAGQWLMDQGAHGSATSSAPPLISGTAASPTNRNPRAINPLPGDNPLARLDADLRRLGALAAARQHKLGGNPCEVGRIGALNLNYPSERYAFSCDEPLVYTAVQPGEFEPGRPSYLRIYNWREGKFVIPGGPAVSAAPQGAPTSSGQ